MTILGFTFTTKAELRHEVAALQKQLSKADEQVKTLKEANEQWRHEYGKLYKAGEEVSNKLKAAENTINQLRQSNDILRTKLAKYEPKRSTTATGAPSKKFDNRDIKGRFAKVNK